MKKWKFKWKKNLVKSVILYSYFIKSRMLIFTRQIGQLLFILDHLRAHHRSNLWPHLKVATASSSFWSGSKQMVQMGSWRKIFKYMSPFSDVLKGFFFCWLMKLIAKYIAISNTRWGWCICWQNLLKIEQNSRRKKTE